MQIKTMTCFTKSILTYMEIFKIFDPFQAIFYLKYKKLLFNLIFLNLDDVILYV